MCHKTENHVICAPCHYIRRDCVGEKLPVASKNTVRRERAGSGMEEGGRERDGGREGE